MKLLVKETRDAWSSPFDSLDFYVQTTISCYCYHVLVTLHSDLLIGLAIKRKPCVVCPVSKLLHILLGEKTLYKAYNYGVNCAKTN